MEASLIQFEVGQTIHKQPLTLTWNTRDRGWVLTKDAFDQRDDTCVIAGIPDEVILNMAEAVKARKQK